MKPPFAVGVRRGLGDGEHAVLVDCAFVRRRLGVEDRGGLGQPGPGVVGQMLGGLLLLAGIEAWWGGDEGIEQLALAVMGTGPVYAFATAMLSRTGCSVFGGDDAERREERRFGERRPLLGVLVGLGRHCTPVVIASAVSCRAGSAAPHDTQSRSRSGSDCGAAGSQYTRWRSVPLTRYA
jgi:hypothetical protein